MPLVERKCSTLPVVVAALLTGCSINDLKGMGSTLLDPERTLLQPPGTRIASGHFSNLRSAYSLEVGHLVLALNHDEAQPRLSVTSRARGTCFAAEAQQFWPFSGAFTANGTTIIGASTTGLIVSSPAQLDESATLSFTDYDCSEVAAPLESARLVHPSFYRGERQGVVVVTESGSLLMVFEQGDAPFELASDVEETFHTYQGVWTLSSGRLDYHHRNGTTAYAENVNEMATGDWGEVAFRSEGVLFRTNPERGTGSVEAVAPDGCDATFVRRGWVFRWPCGSSRFAVLPIAPPNEPSWTAPLVMPNVEGVVALDRVWIEPGATAIYFLTSPEPTSSIRDLWVATVDGQAARIGAAGHIEDDLLFLDWDGEKGRAIEVTTTLNDGALVADVETIAEGVVQRFGPGWLAHYDGVGGWLAHYDGQVGDLLLPGGQIVATGIPPQQPVFVLDLGEQPHLVFVADYDGHTGSLATLDLEGHALRRVAHHVLPHSLQVLREPFGYAYQAEPTPGERSLRVYLPGSQLEQTIASGVSEFWTFSAPGIVYSVPSGDRAGIWWVSAH